MQNQPWAHGLEYLARKNARISLRYDHRRQAVEAVISIGSGALGSHVSFFVDERTMVNDDRDRVDYDFTRSARCLRSSLGDDEDAQIPAP